MQHCFSHAKGKFGGRGHRLDQLAWASQALRSVDGVTSSRGPVVVGVPGGEALRADCSLGRLLPPTVRVTAAGLGRISQHGEPDGTAARPRRGLSTRTGPQARRRRR